MAAARETEHPGYNVMMANVPQTATEARRMVRTACAAWGIEKQADTAQLVLSELIANAVHHTRGRHIRVIVEHPRADRLLIAVVDTSRDLPIVRTPHTADVRGRGLLLIQALSAHWGCTRPGRGGKHVWALLEADPGQER
ncbi:ATP-binding protein [Streptomyces longisporoflavus]|uniref:ATP-binding protein n=1 Tax=Streptomyces longisporoflavus TaxID=28044 RepID=UPI00167CC3AD|nr:ATP-binding protein [Streptomyces longisporoflavus]GGV69906.1 ATP-binding protein [Streptomyces longisporoflavus]